MPSSTVSCARSSDRRPERRRPRALDAGCGTGFQTAILLELGYVTTGLDISSGLLRAARARCAGASLVQGDVEALPCRDGTMDLVISCGSTLSFVTRPERAFAEIARVLRPGGRLLLEVEHRWSLDLAWRLASSLAGDPLGYGVEPREARRAFAPATRRQSFHGLPRLPAAPALHAIGAPSPPRRRTASRASGAGASTASPMSSPPRCSTAATLGRTTGTLYRGLRALDRALAGTPAGRALANSLVVLATKGER